jgi:hypothetical protein
MVSRAPGLAADIAAAGHEAGVHGWSHRYSVARSPWAAHTDLARARDEVAHATRTSPRWYRPPYGVLSAGALGSARCLGLTPVLWTCWGREWAPGATPASVYRTLEAGLAPGATVLLHDSDCPAEAAGRVRGTRPASGTARRPRDVTYVAPWVSPRTLVPRANRRGSQRLFRLCSGLCCLLGGVRWECGGRYPGHTAPARRVIRDAGQSGAREPAT